MNMISREAHYKPGPRFFRSDDGVVMFEHRIDSSSMIGPRPASKIDKENNPDLWAAFFAQQPEEEAIPVTRSMPVKKPFGKR